MEFSSIHSHQDDTQRMHYTHGTESEGKMKIEKKNSKKKIHIILSLTEEENFKVKIEKKNWKKIQIRRIEKKKFDFFFSKKILSLTLGDCPCPMLGSNSKLQNQKKLQVQNIKFKTSNSKPPKKKKIRKKKLQKKI